jgi:hypothetical protein
MGSKARREGGQAMGLGLFGMEALHAMAVARVGRRQKPATPQEFWASGNAPGTSLSLEMRRRPTVGSGSPIARANALDLVAKAP